MTDRHRRADPRAVIERQRFTRALFPGLAQRVDRAYAATGNAQTSPAEGIDAWLDAESQKFQERVLTGVAFAEVLDTAAREAVANAFTTAQSVAAWGGVNIPAVESFVTAGVDLAALGRALADDPTLQLVPTPFGLGLAWWRDVYARGCELEQSPLRDGGLILASEIERGFRSLDELVESSSPQLRLQPERGVRPGAARPSSWTLRLIPATEAPSLIGLSFTHGPHVTLPEMLMLQLMRTVMGAPPVDERSFTWIAGDLADGKLAARHIFDLSDGAVRLSAREPGQQGPHLGARPPIG